MANTGAKIYRPVRQIQDIRQVLGVKGGLGRLCTSAAINERAACKPTNLATYSLLTEEQRKATNYSIYIGTYYNPIALVREVVKGIAWGYNKPQAPYYRQGDFDGYNHYATDWVTVKPQTDTISSDRNLAMDFYGNDDALLGSLEALAELLELGYLANYENLNFGFLFKKGAFTETIANCYYIPLTGMLTIRDIVDNGRLTIPANTFDGTGTWYMIPCFTTAQFEQGKVVYLNAESGNIGTWLPVPYSNICSVEVSATSPDAPVDTYVDVELESANVGITDLGVVSMSDVKVRAINTSVNTDYRVVVSDARINSGVINGPVILAGGSANVPANGSAVITIQSSQIQFEVADPSLERIAVELEYYIDNNSAQKRTKYIYVELFNVKRRRES